MKISEIFQKDIARPINGVIKADQLDEESVWQELDEFVVTKELSEHLRKFFARYCETLHSRNSTTSSSKNGVWVSGFFGSGKSHFIKVLFHLLANEEHSHIDLKTQQKETKRAVEFFEGKIDDPVTYADLKRAVASKTDVILFNIDSKADDKDAQKYNIVLAVFLKVLNQKLGYSPDHFHIAHLERYLDEKGKYQEFQNIYKTLTATDWKQERDAYEFNRDEVIETFSNVLGQSKEASEKWFDSAENHVPLTVENFAKWTKEYLDKQDKKHRIVFFADEIGQFIGSDTNLMLNLQTIVEQLGTVCGGRAWIVVTSQEDIDAVIQTQTKARKDFSKIQGRFETRLNLSSRNVDEVIQERLLRKKGDNPVVKKTLSQLYHEKGDILKNQLSFKDCSFTWNEFKSEDDFAQIYPFVPYQFKLLQFIFESIRQAGVAGIHLAQGERSLLDAFQLAAKTVMNDEVGVLVPLYRFFPAIENFLESPIKRSFEHVKNVAKPESFDADILRVLFLIRRVDKIRGNIDNLVTLCLDQVDADRVELKKQIEASLDRLERESLIKVNDGVYSFLTNEEQDVRREIKEISVTLTEKSKCTGKIIFDEIFQERKKYKHPSTKKDFQFNRLCDQQPVDRHIEKAALLVSIISPFYDGDQYNSDPRCFAASIENNGKILIRLSSNIQFERELQNYIRIKKYIDSRSNNHLPETMSQILQTLRSENDLRKKNIDKLLTEILTGADYFIAGQKLTLKALTPEKALDEAFNKFIENKYDKLSFLQKHENPQREIHAILFRDDVVTLDLNLPENNPLALEEVRKYIELSTLQNKEINLYDVCYGRFSEQPYGWLEMDTALLFVRLYAAREINFIIGGDIPDRRVLDNDLKDTKNWQRIGIVQKKAINPETLKKARDLGRSLFMATGPSGEVDLYKFLTAELKKLQEQLNNFTVQVTNGQYPGKDFIDEFNSIVSNMLRFNENESQRFFKKFNEQSEYLLQLNNEYRDVCNFFTYQKSVWDAMLKKIPELRQNRRTLERNNESIKKTFEQLDTIKNSPKPYSMIHEIPALLNTITAENN
ncbi:MAG: BREX system P-loop protein BrxC, partial [Planctomycetaceae bacterium]|nr:BREX system P-loop protein BrxC [Planctomycetaceae bacterium]